MKRVLKKIFVILLLLTTVVALGEKRSSKWTSVRKAYLKANPECALCFVQKDLNVHHIKPFHLFPHLELEPTNLITLCRSKYLGLNCHLRVGHGGNYRYYNPWLMHDIQNMHRIMENNTKEDAFIILEEYMVFIKKRVKIYNRSKGK